MLYALTAPLIVALALSSGIPPHGGAAHRAKHLTKKMNRTGATAALLYQRSLCYRELDKPTLALSDLHQALRLSPRHIGSLVDRPRILMTLGRPEHALAAAQTALQVITVPIRRSSLFLIRAEALTASKRYEEAAVQTTKALDAVPGQPLAILHRSVLRSVLGQGIRRVRELEAAYARSQHPIIEAEWFESLLETSQLAKAREVVDRRLADSRLKCGWWIRRARLHLAVGSNHEAESDLMHAWRELSSRLHPDKPDWLLVADRAIVLKLLGQAEGSQADVARLRSVGYPRLLQLRLESILAKCQPIRR